MWEEARRVLFPNAKVFNGGGGEGEPMVLVCVREEKVRKRKPWWEECERTMAMSFSTFERNGGRWFKCYENSRTEVAWDQVKRACARSRVVVRDGWEEEEEEEEVMEEIVPVFCGGIKGGVIQQRRRAQELAFAWQQQRRGGGGGVVVSFEFRPDYIGGCIFGFCVVPDWNWFEAHILAHVSAGLRNFYEIVGPDVPVGLFLDLDGVYEEFPVLQTKSKEEVVQLLFATIAEEEDCPGVTRENVYVFDSSNERKLSLHLVASSVNSTHYWANTKQLKKFMARVRERFARALGIVLDPKKRAALIDMSVYDRNHNFRLPFCTKFEQQRYKMLSEELNRAPPPRCYADMLVCKPGAQVTVVEEEEEEEEVGHSSSASLENYGDLWAFLRPFEERGQQRHHNYRWEYGRRKFLVPRSSLEALAQVMVQASKPLLLQEAPSSEGSGEEVRVVLDFDDVSFDESLLQRLCEAVSSSLWQYRVYVLEPPDRKGFHVALQIKVASYRHFRALVKRQLKPLFPSLDANTALRTIYSDKLIAGGVFAGRVYECTHIFLWNGQMLVEQEEQDELSTVKACSYFCDLADLPLIDVTLEEAEEASEEECQEGSREYEMCLREWRAVLLPSQRNGFRLTKVIRRGKKMIQAQTNLRECPHRGLGAPHKSLTQKGDFDEKRGVWWRSCWSSKCTSYRQEYVFQGFVALGPLAMCRQDEHGRVVEVKRTTQWAEDCSSFRCSNVRRALELLEAVDAYYENEVGVLLPDDEMVIRYYQKKKDISLRSPVVAAAGAGAAELRTMIFAFMEDCLSLPPPPPAARQRGTSNNRWVCVPRDHVFVLDDPADEGMRLPDGFPELAPGMKVILDGTMGCGKTEMVKRLHGHRRLLYVCATRSLAKHAAAKFNIPHHLLDDRVRTDLDQLPQVAIVINSLGRLLSSAANFDMVFWDEFKQIIMALTSSGHMGAKEVVEAWATMKALMANPRIVHFFADANVTPELEGWLIGKLSSSGPPPYVIVKETERNPWTHVACYELLGNESEAWSTAMSLAREQQQRTFMPVNEELSVYVAKELFDNNEACFVCSSRPDARMTESTAAWKDVRLLCASGVISSGLSCTEKVFTQMINVVSNRSSNTWDVSQAWLRQRIPVDRFYFYFRNRGAPSSSLLTLEDLDNLERWTLAELHERVKNGCRTDDRLLLELVVRASQVVLEDRRQFHRNLIQRLHGRRATIRFKAPEKEEEDEEEVKKALVEQRRKQRQVRDVMAARLLSAEEYAAKRQSGEERHAVLRYRLSVKYKIPQVPAYEEALRQRVSEYILEQLPARVFNMRMTMLTADDDAGLLDETELNDPKHLRDHVLLCKQMTRRVLEEVFALPLAWFQEPLRFVEQLEAYALTQEQAVAMYEPLARLLESAEYRTLHKRFPALFPVFGTAKKVEQQVKNFFKAFLKRSRGIPIKTVRKQKRVDHKRVELPSRLMFRMDVLLERFDNRKEKEEEEEEEDGNEVVVDVQSLDSSSPSLSINGGQVVVRTECRFKIFVFNDDNCDGLKLMRFLFRQHRWAWFLRGRVYCFMANTMEEMHEMRLNFVRYGLRLVQQPLMAMTCTHPRLRIDLVLNQVTDVSDYHHHVVLQRPYDPETKW